MLSDANAQTVLPLICYAVFLFSTST